MDCINGDPLVGLSKCGCTLLPLLAIGPPSAHPSSKEPVPAMAMEVTPKTERERERERVKGKVVDVAGLALKAGSGRSEGEMVGWQLKKEMVR